MNPVYVTITKLNQKRFVELNEWVLEHGNPSVDYHSGGWSDGHIYLVAPHLKFEREEDALAYMLTKGGTLSKSIPLKTPDGVV